MRLSAPDIKYCFTMPNGLHNGYCGKSILHQCHCCLPLNILETSNASYFAGYYKEVLQQMWKMWPLSVRDYVCVNTGEFTSVSGELFFLLAFPFFPLMREFPLCLYFPCLFSHHETSLPEAKDQHLKIVTFCLAQCQGDLCWQMIFCFYCLFWGPHG